MKSRMFISISTLVVVVITITGSCATGKKASVTERDIFKELNGTWVNEDYLGTWMYYEQKLIIYPDGKHEYYPLTTDTNPIWQGYFFTITEAWTDSEGVIWYKAIFKNGDTLYVLGKINESEKTLEMIGDGVNDPTEWDTTKTRYSIYKNYYRQE